QHSRSSDDPEPERCRQRVDGTRQSTPHLLLPALLPARRLRHDSDREKNEEGSHRTCRRDAVTATTATASAAIASASATPPSGGAGPRRMGWTKSRCQSAVHSPTGRLSAAASAVSTGSGDVQKLRKRSRPT